jgi:integrating conjugative element protein (TIGR03759 family)
MVYAMTPMTKAISHIVVGCATLLLVMGDAISENHAVSATAVNTSDTTTSQWEGIPLNETRAKAWGLSFDDYERSLELRSGVGSYWDDATDPISILGIHAKTANKRRYYAEKLARFEYQMFDRLQAFENAHSDAWKHLYPKATRFDFKKTRKVGLLQGNAEFPIQQSPMPVQQGSAVDAPDLGRLAYFISLPCHCEAVLSQLIVHAPTTPVDIYIANVNDDQAIQRWAMHMGIPIDLVQRSAITLNHDDGLHLKAGFSNLPMLAERTESGYVEFDLVDLTDDTGWQ